MRKNILSMCLFLIESLYLCAKSYCRVYKPRVPHGSASQQRLGPADDIANDAQLLGRPKYLNNCPEGRSNLSTGRPGQGGTRSLSTPARLSDQKAWPNTTSNFEPRPPTGDALNTCSQLFSNWRNQSRLGPTDRDARSVRTRKRMEKVR